MFLPNRDRHTSLTLVATTPPPAPTAWQRPAPARAPARRRWPFEKFLTFFDEDPWCGLVLVLVLVGAIAVLAVVIPASPAP